MRFDFRKLSKFARYSIALCLSVLLLGVIYWQFLPEKYDLHVGQVSQYDIVATHSLVDYNATRLKAIAEASAISPIFARSEEMSAKSLAKLDDYLSQIYQYRLPVWQGFAQVSGEKLKDTLSDALADFKNTFPENSEEGAKPDPDAALPANGEKDKDKAANKDNDNDKDADKDSDSKSQAAPAKRLEPAKIKEKVKEKVEASYPHKATLQKLADKINDYSRDRNVYVSRASATLLAEAEPSVFMSLVIELRTVAKSIMSQDLNKEKLDITITHKCSKLVETVKSYADLYGVGAPILRSLLAPNLRYDAEATKEARTTVYERAMKNPVQIHRGTRIVNYNDVISESQYENLKQLGLLVQESTPNYQYLLILLCMYIVCLGMSIIYLNGPLSDYNAGRGSNFILIASAVMVILAALYTSKLSASLIPIPFFVLIAVVYFSAGDALFLSLDLVIFLSILSKNTVSHFVVYTFATLIMILIMSFSKQKVNYLLLIVASTLAMLLGAAVYVVFENQTLLESCRIIALCVLNGLLSSLLAVGIIPLLDFTFAAVSPMRLVALAQPDAPLMKRLFMEALGTYQHSMMVANLAESAAEAVGANTLLCRVGAYYHDIGKLEQPLMFTENQDDYNPHDDLQPESSYKIITRHVAMGQKIARRYRLPQALINIIKQHHGTTVLFYFYKKAEKEHEKLHLAPVNKDDWRYPWESPTSKEAAIIMLADSLEAAMKSTGYRTSKEVEELSRKILHDKNSQDQLINSGLSYHDVEKILAAFTRVYAGVFKERVKYPDVSKN